MQVIILSPCLRSYLFRDKEKHIKDRIFQKNEPSISLLKVPYLCGVYFNSWRCNIGLVEPDRSTKFVNDLSY